MVGQSILKAALFIKAFRGSASGSSDPKIGHKAGWSNGFALPSGHDRHQSPFTSVTLAILRGNEKRRNE